MPPIFPDHFAALSDNLINVRVLMDIHVKTAGAGPGYKHQVAVLNKSAIVLVVACWEVYVKDLAAFAFDTSFEGLLEASKVPAYVFVQATKKLKDDKDARKLTELTGDRWRNVLKGYRDEVIDECNQRFTPNPESIDLLFEKLLGLHSLSSTWRWSGCSDTTAKKRLHSLLQLRHSIAHKVVAPRKVYKDDVATAIDLVNRLAATSSNSVRNYMIKELGVRSWLPVKVGNRI